MKRFHPRRSALASTLLQDASSLREGYSEKEILEKAVQVAQQRWGVQSALLITFDPEHPVPIWTASGAPLRSKKVADRLLAEVPLLDQLRKKRSPHFWNDPETPALLIPLSRKIVPFCIVSFVLRQAAWNRADSAAAANIAWQAGAAIQLLRRLRERERALTQWERFHRIVTEISSEQHLQPLFKKIVRRGIGLLEFDSGDLALWDPAQGHFIVRSVVNMPAGSQGSTFRVGEGIGGMAARTAKTIIFHREQSRRAPSLESAQPYSVMVGTPIRIADRILGVLRLQSNAIGRRISEQDRFFLEALADQAALAIENVGRLESNEKELADAEILRKTSIELGADLDRSRLLEAILHRGVSLSGLDVGWLALLEMDEGSLRVEKGIHVSPGFLGKKIKLGEGSVGRAVQERKMLLVEPNLHGGERLFEEGRQLSLERAVIAPMIWKRKIFGVLCLGTRNPHRKISRQEEKVVEAFSQYAAASLAHVSLFESLRREKEEYRKSLEARMEELNLLHQEQARKEKLAALGQIVGSVNHELRQPLEVITNAVYYLKTQLERNEIGPIKKEFERFLAIISDECKSATDLVNELLDFTRNKEAVSIRVDLNQLLENLLRRVQLPEKVRVKTHFSRKTPLVLIDPIQVTRALNNFVLNGIQAMTEGGTLQVATYLTRTSVEVVIRDTGEGIAPENMGRLFEPLFTTKARGVGLGLPLAKQYLEASHGRINVESKVGVGTTFRISFPRFQAASLHS